MTSIVVEFLDDAAFESVERLPEPHRDVAWDLLDHLREAPRYGKPLEAHATTGDLSAARALYVIDFERKQIDWPPPYRIVYRLLPSEANPEKAQVIWAGRRDDLEVYRVAARRLSRQR
jgi:hypothetical protein